MQKKIIMIAGYGSCGQYVLDFITRMEETKDCKIIVVSRTKPEDMMPRINTTIVSAGLMSAIPDVDYIQADLNDVGYMSDILRLIKPDIIAYTGRFIKGIKYGAYSYPNELGYGAWLPLALPLIYNLMKAVKESGLLGKTKVINTSFPDGVCPALGLVGLVPTTGAGNLNHLIPRIRLAYAKMSGMNPNDIDVSLVGAHYLNTYVSKEGNPKGSEYKLELYDLVKEQHIFLTKEDKDTIFSECKIPMETGHTRNLMIASDVSYIIKAFLKEEDTMMHLPGPNGLPGGYYCRVNKSGVELNLLVSQVHEAISINNQSLKCDGIEELTLYGEIVFTDDTINKMKNIFDIDYPKSVKVEDCEEFAYKIKEALIKYENSSKEVPK